MLQAEQTEAAADYFTAALKLDLMHIKAHRNCAIAYKNLDKLELTFKDFAGCSPWPCRCHQSGYSSGTVP